jgi:predicted RNase H-like HicB family nuclease
MGRRVQSPMNMKFHVMLEPQPEGGFTATCIEIPGAISEGDDEAEALDNVASAIRELMQAMVAHAEANARANHATLQTVDVDAEAPS